MPDCRICNNARIIKDPILWRFTPCVCSAEFVKNRVTRTEAFDEREKRLDVENYQMLHGYRVGYPPEEKKF